MQWRLSLSARISVLAALGAVIFFALTFFGIRQSLSQNIPTIVRRLKAGDVALFARVDDRATAQTMLGAIHTLFPDMPAAPPLPAAERYEIALLNQSNHSLTWLLAAESKGSSPGIASADPQAMTFLKEEGTSDNLAAFDPSLGSRPALSPLIRVLDPSIFTRGNDTPLAHIFAAILRPYAGLSLTWDNAGRSTLQARKRSHDIADASAPALPSSVSGTLFAFSSRSIQGGWDAFMASLRAQDAPLADGLNGIALAGMGQLLGKGIAAGSGGAAAIMDSPSSIMLTQGSGAIGFAISGASASGALIAKLRKNFLDAAAGIIIRHLDFLGERQRTDVIDGLQSLRHEERDTGDWHLSIDHAKDGRFVLGLATKGSLFVITNDETLLQHMLSIPPPPPFRRPIVSAGMMNVAWMKTFMGQHFPFLSEESALLENLRLFIGNATTLSWEVTDTAEERTIIWTLR